MKNKNKVPQTPVVSQAPAPADPHLEQPIEERNDDLPGWQQEIVALAKARLSVNGSEDVVSSMHRRAISLCRIVEDMGLECTESEISVKALARVMQIVQEDIHVAAYITNGDVHFYDPD